MNRLLLILFFLTGQQVFSINMKNATVVKSVLATGHWVKAQTNQTGIHRISYSALKSMKFQSPKNVKVFGFPPGQLSRMNSTPSPDDLLPYRIWQTNDKQGNECLLFFVPGSVAWYFDPLSKSFIHSSNQFSKGQSILYLTEDSVIDQSVPQSATILENPSAIVSEFDDFSLFKDDQYNLIESGSRWFSSLLTSGTTLKKKFIFTNHINNEPVIANIAAAGRCDIPTSLSLTINNAVVGIMDFAPYSNFSDADFANVNESVISKKIDGDEISLSLLYNAPGNGMCWLDFISVQTRCKLNMRGGQFIFCDSRSVGPGVITEFHIGYAGNGVKIWDITNPLKPTGISSFSMINTLAFKAVTDSLRWFIAFDPLSDFPGVENIEDLNNQNLHGLPTPDMVIITTPDFKSEADRLASFHFQNSGMAVAVINVSQIFNEFSGGIADATAIRNFVRMLYRKSLKNNTSKLKYLLLFGKGTYDNVHDVSPQNPCFIPTWQSESSVNPATSYVSDDYFGLLGEDEGDQKGNVDIGIGRIPCINLAEANAAVEKTIHYSSSSTMGDWRNIICFIGDDEDNNIHVADSENLANFVNTYYPAFYTDKIYLDAFREETNPEKRYPGVNKALNNRIKDGALIINYIGHANEEGLASEKILTISAIDSWSNINKLPVFVTATCEFSRWDMKNKQSAGEHVLFNKAGGGVALFSTTRLVYSSSNFDINKNFFKYVFQSDNEGNNLRMGDIIRLSKNESGGNTNSYKFSLLGDPALQISYPKLKVNTLEINNKTIQQLTDTIKPLSLVSVWGEITNLKGDKVSGYNGILHPIVFDKPAVVSTLGNNGQIPFKYNVQNSVLFNGNVSVKNGEFTYSFWVPGEINYGIGNGLIRYYSKDNEYDANGSFTSLKLGGSPNNTFTDVAGPTIKLFLDDETFISGGNVSETPLLIAYLEDEFGINISGTGIGHDITMVIDDKPDKMILLNDYFQSGPDSYKKGKILFQLPLLEDGEHTLTFKSWDLANNSTEKSINFKVISRLTIRNITAFPNPAGEFTDIIAVHNRFGEKFSVVIEIFSQEGQLVDLIKTESVSQGFITQPIRWNPGLSSHKPAPGVYHCRVRLTSLDGSTAVKTGQLILTR